MTHPNRAHRRRHAEPDLAELPVFIEEIAERVLGPRELGEELAQLIQDAAQRPEWDDHQGAYGPFVAIAMQAARVVDRLDREMDQ